MNNSQTKQQILQRIGAIPAMEKGRLSTYSFKNRSGVPGPYFKLQQWDQGKNHTRYVRAQEVPALESALAGYSQFEQLTKEYADMVIAETRQNMAGFKKNKSPRRFSSLKRRNSKK